jgi:DNA-binding response OmpR family regulator
LIANEQRDALAVDEAPVSSLGHEVLVSSDVETDEVPAMLKRLRPDVALIRLGTDRGRAVDLIERIVEQAMCPVIPVTHGDDQGPSGPQPRPAPLASLRSGYGLVNGIDVRS